ncbi:MAG: hypothetical protein ACRD5J_11440, partial [Nitrososphaeraceae archaeon]
MSSPTICKYCNKVELVFDSAYKSKTGKMIPLDKTSGLPHQCAESPYAKQQHEYQQQQQTEAPESRIIRDSTTSSTMESQQQLSLNLILARIDRVIELLGS